MPFEPTIGDTILVCQLILAFKENYKNAPEDIEKQKQLISDLFALIEPWLSSCTDEFPSQTLEGKILQGLVVKALEILERIQRLLEGVIPGGSGLRSSIKRKIGEDLDRISPPGPPIYNTAIAGSYGWVLRLDKVKTWISGRRPILLFHGHPGAGKSTMLSFLANHVMSNYRLDPQTAVVFVQAGHGTHGLKSIDDVLRKILRQLCEERPNTLAQVMLEAPCRLSWSHEQIKHRIRLCAEKIPRTFLFVDAIDELQAVMGPGLLVNLLDCQALCNAQMALTSTINESRLEGHLSVEFRAHNTHILRYLENEARGLQQGMLRASSLPDDIVQQIVAISDGVFLIAKLIMEDAENQSSVGQLKQTLSDITRITVGENSNALPKLYEYIFKNIESQHPARLNQAENVIFWVLLSTRILSSDELYSLFCLSAGHNSDLGVGDVPSATGTTITAHQPLQKSSGRNKKQGNHTTHTLVLNATQPTRQLEENVEWLLNYEFWIRPRIMTGSDIFSSSEYFFDSDLAPVRPTTTKALKGFPGIHVAAQFGFELYLGRASIQAADINSTDPSGVTPLMRAAGNGHGGVVEWLLKNGADANIWDNHGRSAFHYAVIGGREETLGCLLRHGVVMKPDVDSMTPLHYAVQKSLQEREREKSERMIGMLLDAGFTINTAVRRSNRTVPYKKNGQVIANVHHNPGVVGGPKDTPVGLTPLHYAVLQGNRKMVAFLLQRGADPSIASEHGETALHIAVARKLQGPVGRSRGYEDAWNDHASTIEFGLEDLPEDPESEESQAEYAKCVEYVEDRRIFILKALLAHPKTNVNSQETTRGFSPLHLSPSVECTTLLLEAEAVPSQRDYQGRVPLQLACLDRASPDRAKVLLDSGASIYDKDDEDRNALHYAIYGGCFATVELILGATTFKTQLTHSKDSRGRTSLHYAAANSPDYCHKSLDILSLLLENGAKVNCTDKDGATPLGLFFSGSWIIGVNIDCLNTLLVAGASFACQKPDGTGLGHQYASSCYKMEVGVLRKLTEYGLDLQEIDGRGGTILHRCAIVGSLTADSVRHLVVEAGLNVMWKNAKGKPH
ncbi:ankyrin repeat-containing domain protein [Immersiella caudata]|uniref:Ankyrin repeat-containing domain protein n=1 Tax=Immersiella caudata TaxID=314043 RepID=A0AA40BWR3_9PEZI|nr:ankyrin repeat-containing domain protein [Immersiella caudata]